MAQVHLCCLNLYLTCLFCYGALQVFPLYFLFLLIYLVFLCFFPLSFTFFRNPSPCPPHFSIQGGAPTRARLTAAPESSRVKNAAISVAVACRFENSGGKLSADRGGGVSDEYDGRCVNGQIITHTKTKAMWPCWSFYVFWFSLSLHSFKGQL